jgi:DNA modification methylase
VSNELNYYLADVEELIPYARNARTHSSAQITQIAASIKEFGFLAPIVIAEDNTILCGHGRFYAAQKLGLKKIPCVKESHLTEAQKRAYIIADNKLSINAGWDDELLAVELSDLQGEGVDLSITGFDEKELADLFDDKSKSDVEDDGYDLSAALEKAAFVQRGDIWTVGRHRLMCGDATSADDVAALMGGKRANLLLTDPPYGVSFKSSSGLTIQNDSIKDEDFYSFLKSAFSAAVDCLEKGAAAYIFHADTEGLNFRRAFVDAGFHLAGCCIWVKDSLVLGRSDYQWQHEPVLYGFLQNGKHSWYSDRKQTTIWNFAKPKKNANHPTSKPLDLLSYPIQNSTQENAVVLDTFGGSGSTLMACELTNRICYTMELDEKYASVILRRYVDDTGCPDDVFVERNGERIPYASLAKAVEHE